ncbi:MAG TPA: class I SAM-dependent RNA methyltransferase [Trebonia sp.]|nr:class I SAM-dependent RNA methyltransferase [Trebonia sp.]
MSFQPGDVVEVTTQAVAQGGWCVARPPGVPVVFVRHALPGERVIVRVTEVTTRFARGDAIEVLEPSPDRVAAPCPSAHPGGCGGCDWQHASLPAQRALKAAVVGEQLRRLAGIDREVTVEELPGTADGLGWRTRVQFAVDDSGLAGLRAHRSHEVIDVGVCPIAHPGIQDLGIPGRTWPGVQAVEVAVAPGQAAGGQAAPGAPAAGAVARGAEREVVVVSDRRPEAVPDVGAEAVLSRYGRKLAPVRGRRYLTQHAAGRDWRVSAGAFWQVHPAAADTLTATVLAALEPKPGDTALDLYCGAGLFTGALAEAVGPQGAVTGVESDEAAVADARYNLRDSPWAKVQRGDVGVVLRGSPPRGGPGSRGGAPRGGRGRPALPPARLAVADPPRSGLDRAVISYLSSEKSGTERFCYVSCDPATLARDLGLLAERGWSLEGLRAFDAFPMTHHVECVAWLAR